MTNLAEELADQSPPEEIDQHLTMAVGCYDSWRSREHLARAGGLRRAFLAHVIRTVPFFRSYFRQLTEDVPLDRFPVTERIGVDQRREELVSEALRDEADRFILTTNRTLHDPVYVSFDRPSIYDFNYASWAFIAGSFAGLRERVRPGKPGLIFISDGSKHVRSTQIVPALRATLSRRLPLGHGADEAIARYLRSIDIPLITGKPSSLIRLADVDLALGGRRIHPAAIVCSGSLLYADDRDRLIEHFQAPVRNVYAATEGGVIAIDCPNQDGLHVREDRVKLEVMRDTGDIGDDGTGRLLLTNYFNWAHAFVRYAIGDQATLRHIDCPCGHTGMTLVSPPSRDAARFSLAGAEIETSELTQLLLDPGVSQFQAIQTADARLVVRFIPRPGVDSLVVAARLRARLRHQLAVDVEIDVVESLFPTGGKLRRYVAEARPPGSGTR